MLSVPHKSYFFLASPYKGTIEEKEHRYQMFLEAVAFFLERGVSVISPILYNQAVISYFQTIQPEERYKLLMPMNLDLLYPSQGLLLLKVKGWDRSKGIQQYLEICKINHIPVFNLDPHNMEHTLNRMR